MSETAIKAVQQLIRERDEARAEVERLRAAVPDLPDVGPVTRGHLGVNPTNQQMFSGDLLVDGCNFDPDKSAEYYRDSAVPVLRNAARRLALVAFLNREAEERAAADTTTDDEVLAVKLKAQYADGPDIGRWVRVAELARSEIDRARTHGEATNGTH